MKYQKGKVKKKFCLKLHKKYLGIKLIKEMNNLYAENYKTLIKEIKYCLKKWKDIPCSVIRRNSIVKLAIILKAVYKCIEICVK